MYISKPINFEKNESIESITLELNQIFEKMILKILINGFGHTIDGK